MTYLNELNDYLAEFLDPNGKVKAKMFEDHRLANIAQNMIPNSWHKAMAMHNFNPLIHPVAEFIQFCNIFNLPRVLAYIRNQVLIPS